MFFAYHTHVTAIIRRKVRATVCAGHARPNITVHRRNQIDRKVNVSYESRTLFSRLNNISQMNTGGGPRTKRADGDVVFTRRVNRNKQKKKLRKVAGDLSSGTGTSLVGQRIRPNQT